MIRDLNMISIVKLASMNVVATTCLNRIGRFHSRNILLQNLEESLKVAAEEDIRFKDIGDKGLITLNRSKALNALNLSMIQKIYPVLKDWESSKKFVLIQGAGGKAFCAGGDVKSISLALNKKDGYKLGQEFFRREYRLNHLIANYKKPYIALMNGITMGGGVGLSIHGKYRIATENTLFAMPETAIGLFPDVGGTYFLSRLKGKLGLFLGLTGHRLKGIDVLRAEIATHYIPSGKIEELIQALLNCDGSDIDSILKKYQGNVTAKFTLEPQIDVINRCFSAPTVEGIIERLNKENSEWARQVVENLQKMSPTSLKVTKKAIEKGAGNSLADSLKMEYRLACACLNKKSDFYEGVRALLVDKTQNPAWNPKTLNEVTNEQVDRYFASLPNDLELMLSEL